MRNITAYYLPSSYVSRYITKPYILKGSLIMLRWPFCAVARLLRKIFILY